MARATSTLPASLLTAHYIKSEIVNPFEAFLNTFQRTNNMNELVSEFCRFHDVSPQRFFSPITFLPATFLPTTFLPV